MDYDNGNKKGHTSAGEFGSPSTGVGGVVAQAPPSSSSDVCELGGVDSLAPQDGMVTREDPVPGVSSMPSSSAKDGGVHDGDSDDSIDFEDLGSLFEAEPDGVERSEADLDSVVLGDRESSVELDDGDGQRSAVFAPLARFTKRKREKKVTPSQCSGSGSERSLKHRKVRSSRRNRKCIASSSSSGGPGKEEEDEGEPMSAEDREGLEMYARRRRLEKAKMELEDNLLKWECGLDYWDENEKTESVAVKGKLEAEIKELEGFLIPWEERMRRKAEECDEQWRLEEEEKKRQEVQAHKDMLRRYFMEKKERKDRESLEKEGTDRVEGTVEEKRSVVVEEPVRPVGEPVLDPDWLVSADTAAASWEEPGVGINQALSPQTSQPMVLGSREVGVSSKTEVEEEQTSPDVLQGVKVRRVEEEKKEEGKVTSEVEVRKPPEGLKIKNVCKLDKPVNFDQKGEVDKVAMELKKLYGVVVDLAKYIQSNKNIRLSYKQVCEDLPKEVKKVIKINRELSNKIVKDVAIMTSPVAHTYLDDAMYDDGAMEVCCDEDPQTSFADVLKMTRKPAKKRKLVEKVDKGYDKTYSSDRMDSSAEEEDLETVDKLLQMNLELLSKQKDLKRHIKGLNEIGMFVEETEVKLEELKSSHRNCDKDKINQTEEIIMRMKRVVNNRVDGKLDRKLERKEEVMGKKREDQQRIWRRIQKGEEPVKEKQEVDASYATEFPLISKGKGKTTLGNVVPKRTSRPRWSVARTDGVMISANNEDEFREIYNKISLCPVDITNRIKKIRRTRTGNLVIESTEGGNIGLLKRGICNNLSGVEMKTLQKAFDLEVKNLDPMVTSETIALAIANHLEIDVEELRVKVLRMARGGTQTAVIDTPTRLIDKCLERNQVKIGFSRVSLVPTPKLIKCFKCHLIGHFEGSCTSKVDGVRCRKCGLDGHDISACTNRMCCIMCKERKLPDGHIVNSMACPGFREIVYSQRDKLLRNFQERKRFESERSKLTGGQREGVLPNPRTPVQEKVTTEKGFRSPKDGIVGRGLSLADDGHS